jgi:hypothetical protein
MASPPKPSAPHLTPMHSDNSGWEFEAAIERVQRRETTPPRKGFDEQRPSEDLMRDAAERDEDDAPEREDESPDGENEALGEPAPGQWTPFSDVD